VSERAQRPIERLFPDPGPTTIADEVGAYDPVALAAAAEANAAAERPFVAVNFAATLDGRAAIGGRSGPIGTEIDSALLMRLRTRFDAVMIGAGTMRAERYGRLVPDPDLRARRERVGLPHDPLAVILSARLDLPWEAGLFTGGGGRVLIFTASAESPPQTATPVRCVRGRHGIADILRYLRRERGVRALLCEGGPTVHGELQAAGAVDELFLTLGPRLTGGAAPRVVEGELPAVRDAELRWLLRYEDELMARYAMRA